MKQEEKTARSRSPKEPGRKNKRNTTATTTTTTTTTNNNNKKINTQCKRRAPT